MDVVSLSRIQFGLATAFLIVFPTLTIGPAIYLVLWNGFGLALKMSFTAADTASGRFTAKSFMGKAMNNWDQAAISESGGTFMAFIRIKQIVLRTGRVMLLGLTLLLVVQIPFNDILYGAGSQLKSGSPSQKVSGISSKKILEINSDITSSSGEIINIVLTGSYPPEAQVIEGDAPRIFCDFPDVRMEKNVKRTIGVNGKYVLQIRTGIHPPPEPKTRVVLDLVPEHDYEVEQLFFEKENRYSIIIREKP